MRRGIAAWAVLASGLWSAPGVAQPADLLAVGEVPGTAGATVHVPIYVRDLAGTTLDEGDCADRDCEIQSFSFRIDFAPASAIAVADFEEAGVTVVPGIVRLFRWVDATTDHVSVLLSYDTSSSSDPLQFVLDAAAPGDLIGNLVLTLVTPLAEPTVALHLQSSNAALVNRSATLDETVADGELLLADGRVLLLNEVLRDDFELAGLSRWQRHQP